MSLRTANPWRNQDTGTYYYRQKVPVDLVPFVGRKIEKISLRTRDPVQARRLFAQHTGVMQECWHVLRLSIATMSEDRIRLAVAECRHAFVRRPLHGGTETKSTASTPADTRSRNVGKADDAGGTVLAFPMATPKPDSEVGTSDLATMQADSVVVQLPPAPAHQVSITMSFEIYARTVELAPSTVKRWRPVFEHLKVFVGHDDVRLLTREVLAAWRDDLSVARSPVTVRDVYLASVKATLSWLVDEGRIPTNVASGVKVRAGKTQQLRSKSLSTAEAETILRASLLPYPGLRLAHAAARRWVPWICAYTGARVNEITQLRRQDILMEDGIWYFRITPEAGTVKTKMFRNVPMHPDLVEQGFLDFVRMKGPDAMFHVPRRPVPGGDPHPPYKKIAERLAAWVRKLGITDEGVSPSHGWRHRFKTEGRSAGVDSRILDAIQGHAAASEGDQYGDYPLESMLRGMLKMPDYSHIRR